MAEDSTPVAEGAKPADQSIDDKAKASPFASIVGQPTEKKASVFDQDVTANPLLNANSSSNPFLNPVSAMNS